MPSTQAPVVSVIQPPAGGVADRLRVAAALVVAAGCAVALLGGGVPDVRVDFLLGSMPFALGPSALVAALLVTRGPWQRPALLVWPGEGRLRVVAGSGFSWFVAGEVMILTAPMPVAAGNLLRDHGASTGPDWYALALAVLAAVLIVVLVATVFGGRPRVDLTPSGVEIREPFGRRSVPWAALAPGTPARQTSGRRLVLRVTRPELVHRRGFVLGSAAAPVLDLTWLRVQPWFLADVLRWYVDHPQERAALGSGVGNDRLCRALGVR